MLDNLLQGHRESGEKLDIMYASFEAKWTPILENVRQLTDGFYQNKLTTNIYCTTSKSVIMFAPAAAVSLGLCAGPCARQASCYSHRGWR